MPFQGQTNNKTYAIFQCKPQRVTEAQNRIDLIAELQLLALGQYFTESFALHLAAHEVDMSTSESLTLCCTRSSTTLTLPQVFAGISKMLLLVTFALVCFCAPTLVRKTFGA